MSQLDLTVSKQNHRFVPTHWDTFAQIEKLDINLDSPRLRKAWFNLGIAPNELKFKAKNSSNSPLYFLEPTNLCTDLDHIEHLKMNTDKYKAYNQKFKQMQEEKHRLLVNKVLQEYARIRKDIR